MDAFGELREEFLEVRATGVFPTPTKDVGGGHDGFNPFAGSHAAEILRFVHGAWAVIDTGKAVVMDVDHANRVSAPS